MPLCQRGHTGTESCTFVDCQPREIPYKSAAVSGDCGWHAAGWMNGVTLGWSKSAGNGTTQFI